MENTSEIEMDVQDCIAVVLCQQVTMKYPNRDTFRKWVKDTVILYKIGSSHLQHNIDEDEDCSSDLHSIFDSLDFHEAKDLRQEIEHVRISGNKILNLFVTEEDESASAHQLYSQMLPCDRLSDFHGTNSSLLLDNEVGLSQSDSEHSDENDKTCFNPNNTNVSVHKKKPHISNNEHPVENKLICEICNCNKNFKHYFSYLLHKTTHTFVTDNKGLYGCNMCHKKYKLAKYLLRHKRLSCPYSEFVCNHCDKRQVSQELLQFHMKYSCSVFKSQKFYCAKCDKKFVTKNGFQKHKRKKACGKVKMCKTRNIQEAAKQSFQCDQCGKIYSNNNSLRKHIRNHQGIKNCECQICHKTFADNYQLCVHSRMHTKEKPYLCSLCGKSFGHAGHLGRHTKTKHNSESIYSVLFAETLS